jgi:hypothetical protein
MTSERWREWEVLTAPTNKHRRDTATTDTYWEKTAGFQNGLPLVVIPKSFGIVACTATTAGMLRSTTAFDTNRKYNQLPFPNLVPRK